MSESPTVCAKDMGFAPSAVGKSFDLSIDNYDRKRGKDTHRLVITPDSFEIYKIGSTNATRRVEANDIIRLSMSRDQGDAVLVLTADSADRILLRCGKMAELKLALEKVPKKAKAVNHIAAVVKSLGCKESPAVLHKYLTDLGQRILKTFKRPKVVLEVQISGVIACAMKVRYGTVFALEEVGTTIEKEVRHWSFCIWLTALEKAMELDVTTEYVKRIIITLSHSAVVMGKKSGLKLPGFIASTAFFFESGNVDGLRERVKQAMEMGTKKTRNLDPMVRRIYTAMVLVLACSIIGELDMDIDDVKERCFLLVLGQGKPTDIEEFDKGLGVVVGNMLRVMRLRKYERIFQYVFALWPLTAGPFLME